MTVEFLLLLATFLAGFLLVFGINLVVTDVYLTDQRERRIQMLTEIRQQQRQRAKESTLLSRDFSEIAAEALEETAAGQQSIAERLEAMLWQAGMNITVERLLTICGLCGVAVAALIVTIFANAILAVLAGLICVFIPLLVIQIKRDKRLERLRAQLPDSFDLMARVMRAGQTISQGMQSVAQEMEAPIAIEFAYCYEQQNLGLNPELALCDLAKRTGLLEIKIFVLALIVHRQSGGNLTELLEKLSEIVRDRFRLRSKIKAVTSEGRMQGLILMLLPVGVYGILLVMNRTYALKLFDHPWLPVTTLIMMALGGIWIRKIVNFDF